MITLHFVDADDAEAGVLWVRARTELGLPEEPLDIYVGHKVLVAKLDGRPVGINVFYAGPGATVVYGRVGYVEPDARGAGVWRAMKDHRFAWAKANGYQHWQTIVVAKAEKMRAIMELEGAEMLSATFRRRID